MNDQNIRKYKQLTQPQRYHINAYRTAGFALRKIAEFINVSCSTVSRELSRNATELGYNPDTAQEKTETRRREALKSVKFNEQHLILIKKGLKDGWSPEQIGLRMAVELGENEALSHTFIYQHVEKDKAQGGDLYTLLPRHGKKRWKKRPKRNAGVSCIPDRIDISERPKEIETRERLGDWEGDTVFGKDAHFVTIVDRKSRFLLVKKVFDKTKATVSQAIIELLSPFTNNLSLTLDNGGEFAGHVEVTKHLGIDIYFAKPYASYQRGTNENTNGLLRRIWPKKTNFINISEEALKQVVEAINMRPRIVLNGLTPYEVYTGERVALIS